MFRIADLIRRARTAAARTWSNDLPPHPINRFRPMLNPMEDRTVPAVYYWLGGGSNTFGTVGDWTLDPVNKAPAAGTPTAGDEAVYDSGFSNAVCAEVGAADPFGYQYLSSIAAIRVVNGYAGVLGFPRALSVGTFEMTSADAQTDQYTDLTVTGTFTWTGGTLNLNTAAANLILSGAIATIAPEGGGTVTTGDNLNFINGATGTFNPGTVTFNNNAGMAATAATVNVAADQNIGVKWIKGNGSTLPQFTLEYNSLYHVSRINQNEVGFHSTELAILNHSGSVVIDDGIQMAVNGRVGADGPSYYQNGGQTTLYSGSTVVVDFGMQLLGGEFRTWIVDPNHVATIQGDVTFDGGTGGTVTFLGGLFGQLKVDGNVNWWSGTYSPIINGPAGNQSSYLWATGIVAIGNDAALDSQVIGVPPSGNSWIILQADGGFSGNLPLVPEGYTSFLSADGDQWLLRKN